MSKIANIMKIISSKFIFGQVNILEISMEMMKGNI